MFIKQIPLPVELQNLILFRYGGLEHPISPMIKVWIKRCNDNELEFQRMIKQYGLFVDWPYWSGYGKNHNLLRYTNNYRDSDGNWI